ncbi:hypothetical protein SAMN05421740_101319 [Parapedobacter koreensis]|uniref:Uncharacterized protein n=1 Tax=Parapedobacter koreensis TaxID=332977 RepID=A0A1H7FDU5_9SPHI|nr:hypothetical protein SAMN05421740_101319 [Parapedobacter koreensis]
MQPLERHITTFSKSFLGNQTNQSGIGFTPFGGCAGKRSATLRWSLNNVLKSRLRLPIGEPNLFQLLNDLSQNRYRNIIKAPI